MIILGLDSARTTGFALVERTVGPERLLEYGTIEAAGAEVIQAFATRMATRKRPPDLVAIEDGFLGKNVVTLKSLCYLVGRWQQAFESMGVETITRMADRWQRGLLGRDLGGTGNRESRKKAAAIWTKAWFKQTLDEDAADAACLATWELRQHVFTNRA